MDFVALVNFVRVINAVNKNSINSGNWFAVVYYARVTIQQETDTIQTLQRRGMIVFASLKTFVYKIKIDKITEN